MVITRHLLYYSIHYSQPNFPACLPNLASPSLLLAHGGVIISINLVFFFFCFFFYSSCNQLAPYRAASKSHTSHIVLLLPYVTPKEGIVEILLLLWHIALFLVALVLCVAANTFYCVFLQSYFLQSPCCSLICFTIHSTLHLVYSIHSYCLPTIPKPLNMLTHS